MGTQKQLPLTGEVGGTGQSPVPPDLSGNAASPQQRNSSGSASAAASMLDLRVRVTQLARQVAMLANLMGFVDLKNDIERDLQRGFRRGR